MRDRGPVPEGQALEPHLGELLADMLVTMTDRGPDSAGIAIYGGAEAGRAKLTVQSADPEADFEGLDRDLEGGRRQGRRSTVKDTHAVIEVEAEPARGRARRAPGGCAPASRS